MKIYKEFATTSFATTELNFDIPLLNNKSPKISLNIDSIKYGIQCIKNCIAGYTVNAVGYFPGINIKAYLKGGSSAKVDLDDKIDENLPFNPVEIDNLSNIRNILESLLLIVGAFIVADTVTPNSMNAKLREVSDAITKITNMLEELKTQYPNQARNIIKIANTIDLFNDVKQIANTKALNKKEFDLKKLR